MKRHAFVFYRGVPPERFFLNHSDGISPKHPPFRQKKWLNFNHLTASNILFLRKISNKNKLFQSSGQGILNGIGFVKNESLPDSVKTTLPFNDERAIYLSNFRNVCMGWKGESGDESGINLPALP